MNKPSLKKTIISNLAMLKNVDGFKDNSLLLLTSVGIISGKVIDIKDTENLNGSEYLASLIKEFSKDYKKENYSDESTYLPGNDGHITLVNVTILKDNGSTTKIPILTVFFDQVIGVSIGNLNS